MSQVLNVKVIVDALGEKLNSKSYGASFDYQTKTIKGKVLAPLGVQIWFFSKNTHLTPSGEENSAFRIGIGEHLSLVFSEAGNIEECMMKIKTEKYSSDEELTEHILSIYQTLIKHYEIPTHN